MTLAPEIQDRFSRAILSGQPEIITAEILTGGMPAAERYNIYRNNTFITLGQALARNFPVLCRLVGQAFFDRLTHDYIRDHPPKTPLLMTYGEDMAAFLAGYDPVSALPYLPDVAKLEHLWTRCFNGRDAMDFDIGQLQKVAPERFNELIFHFISNMFLMQSEYPLLDIWQLNRDGNSSRKTVNLDQGGCHFAIYRKKCDVEMMAFSEGDYYFLKKLSSGGTLGQVAGEMAGDYPDFNLQEALQRLMLSGLITGFEFGV